MKKTALVLLSILSISAFGFTYSSDMPEAIKTQMDQDLVFMNQIQGSGVSDLHKQIFGNVSGADYKKFFETRVTAIGLNSCGGGPAVACVIPFMGSSKMWLTQNFIKFSHPQISRMMVVYHESRHTERGNGNWPHATCPTPFKNPAGDDMHSIWTGALLEGQPACDVTPFGSYGSSMILLKNVSKFCSNCTDKVKMDAGIYADDQFGRIIDQGARDQITKDLYQASNKRR